MLVLANILQPIIDVFDSVLQFFHNSVGVGWGFSIILLTICVRIILLPLTVKQFKSMQSMSRLAPQIKALQEKYKDDKQRQQQEMMAFYKEHQVNPFGSCLPLVMQMPVFISLFYMLRKDLKVDICPDVLIQKGAIDHAHKVIDAGILQKTACNTDAAHFLFIDDITTKATGAVLVVLIALYIGSQLLSSVLMSTTVDRNQRMLMIGLPFLFTTFIISFPAGLIVYWITTNLWTVAQQTTIRRRMGPIAPPKLATAGAAAAAAVPVDDAKPKPKPTRRFGAKAAEPVVEEKPKPSGPPPSARKKKKRSGRRR